MVLSTPKTVAVVSTAWLSIGKNLIVNHRAFERIPKANAKTKAMRKLL